MDSKEFKLYVRKVLLDNGFNEHSNPTCYIKDMGDYYLRSSIDKSTWSDSYAVDYDIYLKKFNENNSVIKKINPADFYGGFDCSEMRGNWFNIDKYTTDELKRYILIAIEQGLEELTREGIVGFFREYPNAFTIFHKEYIAEHYGKKE